MHSFGSLQIPGEAKTKGRTWLEAAGCVADGHLGVCGFKALEKGAGFFFTGLVNGAGNQAELNA